MGKHSARPTPGASRTPEPRVPTGPAPRAPIPAVLAQTAAFGALAIIVAVVALTWAGIGGREAAAVGLGLLLVGVLGFVLVRRTGLLRDPTDPSARTSVADGRPAAGPPPLG